MPQQARRTSTGGRTTARSAASRRGASRPAARTNKTAKPRAAERDVIAVLKDDHKAVKELFRRYQGYSDRAVKSRQKVADQVTKELSIHAAVEEQVLYPNLRNVRGGKRLADHALDEHQYVKEMLDRLSRYGPEDAEFGRLMKEIRDAVNQHVREEEREVFPLLRREASRDELRRMGTMVRAAKKAAPTRPHPNAPNTPPGNIVIGAAAAVVDRVRDAMGSR